MSAGRELHGAPVGAVTNVSAAIDAWQHLALHIRFALSPDEPRLVTAYLAQGMALVAAHGHEPWRVHERALTLLLDTACDALLPIAWRMSCLDACCRPLGQLGPLVDSHARATRLRTLAWRLARFSLQPADPESR